MGQCDKPELDICTWNPQYWHTKKDYQPIALVDYFERQALNSTNTCIPNHSGLTVYLPYTLSTKQPGPRLLMPQAHLENSKTCVSCLDVFCQPYLSLQQSCQQSGDARQPLRHDLGFSQTLTCQNSNARLDCYLQHRLHPSLQTYQPAPSGRFRLIKTWTICLKMAGRLHTDIHIWLWLF